MRQLLKKGTKWDWATDRNADFNNIKQELTKLPCLAHYNGNKENIVTIDAGKTGLGIALWQKQGNNELKPIAFASHFLNDAEKKCLIGELELLAVVWGLERFRLHLYGKQVQLFSNHQALEPLLKRNKANKQNSARLTRWLDRLNHFNISLKHTAGEEIKFTNFISRKSTENWTGRKTRRRIRNQRHRATSDGKRPYRTDFQPIRQRERETRNKHARRQTNESHTNSNYRTQQLHSNTYINDLNNHHSEMENDQNARYVRVDGQLRYHWGADKEIMTIINKRDKSPEVRNLSQGG